MSFCKGNINYVNVICDFVHSNKYKMESMHFRIKTNPFVCTIRSHNFSCSLVNVCVYCDYSKPVPTTLKAGNLRTHISRCQVCMKRV